MSDLRQRAAWAVVLTAVWVLLNGQPTAGNIVGGLLVAVIVLLAFPLQPATSHHTVHPLAALRLAGYVVWSLITSSIQVVVAVLFPTPARLRSGIVRVELPGATPLVTTLVANSITLTPGTLTVNAQLDPPVIYVHALGLGDLDEFRASIHALHDRATAAFTPVVEEVLT